MFGSSVLGPNSNAMKKSNQRLALTLKKNVAGVSLTPS